MSRDYLPFETHLEKTKTVTSKQKKGPLTPQPSTSEEDSEDEYDLDYEPVPLHHLRFLRKEPVQRRNMKTCHAQSEPL